MQGADQRLLATKRRLEEITGQPVSGGILPVLGKKAARRQQREQMAQLRTWQAARLHEALAKLREITAARGVVVLVGVGCVMDNPTLVAAGVKARLPVAAVARGAGVHETEVHPLPPGVDPKTFIDELLAERVKPTPAAPIALEG